MWSIVKGNSTTKSTVHLIDTEDQLASMKLSDNDDPKTHLIELKSHFQLMLQCWDNLLSMGSTLSDSRFNTILMTSLPASYRPALQTITAAEQTNIALSSSSRQMKSDDLVTLFIEEAEHRVINNEQTKNAELALAAQAKRSGRSHKSQGKKTNSKDLEVSCNNCKKTGHVDADCYTEGGGNEGQAPWQKNQVGEKD